MKTLFLSETFVRSWLLAIVLGFVSGSVLYSKHIPRLFLHKNICENAPDQNPGGVECFCFLRRRLGTFLSGTRSVQGLSAGSARPTHA